MNQALEFISQDEAGTVAWGERLGRALRCGGIVFLHGQLGTGKTTLCRGVLRAFGHMGAVKSPTYPLVEPYCYENTDIYHFDLYRLGHPEELEYLGVRDYFESGNVCLVEWPEKADGMLPAPDVELLLRYAEKGRHLTLVAHSDRGKAVMEKIRESSFAGH